MRVADEGDTQALLAAKTDTFFTTAPYDGYPAVLIRLVLVDLDERDAVLITTWRSRAPAPSRPLSLCSGRTERPLCRRTQ